jgi:diguanylate cyclase (GGDEF)-like protein
MGGDEFAVLSPRTTAEGMAALAGRIGDALSEPYSVHGERPSLGASVGTYLATAGETAPVALERADQAMYEAKRARKAARSPVPAR